MLFFFFPQVICSERCKFFIKKNHDPNNTITSSFVLRDKQKPPKEEWDFWIILAGRGFGKTLAGAHAIIDFIQLKKKKSICLIGATKNETSQIMVTGTSGILNLAQVYNLKYRYYRSYNLIEFFNGVKVFIFSAENYDALRGYQFDCVWADEFAKFHRPEETLEQLIFCCRLNYPQFIITTTPRPLDVLRNFYKKEKTYIVEGTTYENQENLPKSYLNLIRNFEDTDLGNQEIHGQILNNTKSSPWNNIKILQESNIKKEDLGYITLALDPAISNRNETGIILAGYHKKTDKIIILEDFSLACEVKDWLERVVEIANSENVQYIAVETNQGGDLLTYSLNFKLKSNIKIEKFFASTSKIQRAIPIAQLYKQGYILHSKQFYILENQMKFLKGSLDRLDALVWSIESILKNLQKNNEESNCNLWLIDL